MRFDDPAWRRAPLRTGLRVAKSLARRSLPALRSRVPVRYDGGQSLIYADLRTPLGLQLYRYGHRDPDIDLVARLLSPGDVFVDGGANVGLFTLVAARRVGVSGRVVAFEPGRAVRARLIENLALNGLTQVDVLPFALSSASGEATFQEFEIAGAGLNHLAPGTGEGGHVDVVALTTLDASLPESVRKKLVLIKLDLEGAEHAALLGSSAVLTARHPDLLIEVEPAHLARMGSTPAAVAGLLREHGYEFFRPTADGDSVCVSRVDDLTARTASPNVFATVDADRARQRGIRFR
jgi:FkbM family methyltransferase